MASPASSQTAALQNVIVSSELLGSEVKKGEMLTDHQTERSLGKTNYCSLHSLKLITQYGLSHSANTGPQLSAQATRLCYLTLRAEAKRSKHIWEMQFCELVRSCG